MISGLPSVAFFGASVGGGELLLLFAVVLVLFGPQQLPKVARSIGKALEELRSASREFRDQVMNAESEISDPLADRHEALPEPQLDQSSAADDAFKPDAKARGAALPAAGDTTTPLSAAGGTANVDSGAGGPHDDALAG